MNLSWSRCGISFLKLPAVNPSVRGPDQQLAEPVSKPCAENEAEVPSSKANSSTEEPAEAKKNKRERKAERQKNRKKEKKELRLENHQENAESQKPKKRKAVQEAEQEAADGSSGTKNQRKKSKAERTQDGAVDGGAEVGEQADAGPGKIKRKHSEVESDSKKKMIKLPENSEDGEPENHEAPAKGKFNRKGTIKAVLKQAPDHEITIKKLRKKVLAQDYAVTNELHKSEQELPVIFNKTISKNHT